MNWTSTVWVKARQSALCLHQRPALLLNGSHKLLQSNEKSLFGGGSIQGRTISFLLWCSYCTDSQLPCCCTDMSLPTDHGKCRKSTALIENSQAKVFQRNLAGTFDFFFFLANNDIYCQELLRSLTTHLLCWVSPGYFWLDSFSSGSRDLWCPLKFSCCITFPCTAFVTQHLFFQPRFICEGHCGLAVIRAQKPPLCFWIVLINSVLIENWYKPGDQSFLSPMSAQASPQGTFGLT